MPSPWWPGRPQQWIARGATGLSHRVPVRCCCLVWRSPACAALAAGRRSRLPHLFSPLALACYPGGNVQVSTHGCVAVVMHAFHEPQLADAMTASPPWAVHVVSHMPVRGELGPLPPEHETWPLFRVELLETAVVRTEPTVLWLVPPCTRVAGLNGTSAAGAAADEVMPARHAGVLSVHPPRWRARRRLRSMQCVYKSPPTACCSRCNPRQVRVPGM